MESMQASRHMSSSQHQHEEAVREVEQVRHTNETLQQENPSSTYRAQTEASNIRIVTPNYKTGEKPSSDLKTGVDVADLNAKFSETNGDYKAERSQEHFRMQIIDPKVNSNAHLPAHAPREYARKKLMEDFPSLHGKRSFLNLDSMEQRRVRNNNVDLDQLRQSLDALQKAPPPPKEHNRETMNSRTSNGTSFNSSAIHREHQDRSEYVTEPIRREIVEVRREQVVSKPKVTQTVQRFEENKRTEEVERRVIRRERRHKSHRTRYGHGYQQEYDYHNGGGGGYRSTSASRGGGYNTNGYAHPITYESHHTSSRRGGGGEHERFSAASDLYSQHNRGMAHARYGSLSDSLRRGELKYIPNGEVREANGQNGYSKHTKVHKSHSTRDVFGHNGGNYGSHYSFNNRHGNFEQPVVEFPPTLPRGGRYGSHLDAPVPPPHRGGGDSYRPLTKSRSYADWDQGRGPFGNSVSRYDEDMARLENEFRDSHLIRVPNGPMNEKEYRHQEIPGGYESYSRDTKANGGRKLNRDGLPTDFKESSQEYNFKREQQR